MHTRELFGEKFLYDFLSVKACCRYLFLCLYTWNHIKCKVSQMKKLPGLQDVLAKRMFGVPGSTKLSL